MPGLGCDGAAVGYQERWGGAFQAEGTAGAKQGSTEFLQGAGLGGRAAGEAEGTEAGTALPAGVLLAVLVQEAALARLWSQG